jgi:septum site-determining protein MinD
MTRVIVITSGKGGVGKTTTTSNLGMALAGLKRNVVLIDADVSLRNLDLLLGLENRVVYTGIEVLNETCRLEQALIQDKREPNLTFFPLSSSQSKEPITLLEMERLITLLKEDDKYDFILIDSPAGIEASFRTAVSTANEALIVVTPEIPSIRDADRVIGILLANGISKISLLVNRIRPKMVEEENMMSVEDVKSILGLPVIGAIPDSEQVITASNRGEPLVLEVNLSTAGLAFKNVARRLVGEEVKFLDFNLLETKNPLKRLLKRFKNKTD